MLVIMLPCSKGSARTVQSIFQLNGQSYLAKCFYEKKKKKKRLNISAKQDLFGLIQACIEKQKGQECEWHPVLGVGTKRRSAVMPCLTISRF